MPGRSTAALPSRNFDPARIKTFSDYRAMYDTLHKEIDLVLIATPDHQYVNREYRKGWTL